MSDTTPAGRHIGLAATPVTATRDRLKGNRLIALPSSANDHMRANWTAWDDATRCMYVRSSDWGQRARDFYLATAREA
jgi:hypothetical protein